MESNQIKGNSQAHSIDPDDRSFEVVAESDVGLSHSRPVYQPERPREGFVGVAGFLGTHGIFPSSFTFCSLIHSFSNEGDMSKAIEVLDLMTDEKVKYPFDNFVSSSVISGFCKIGKPEIAVKFLENAVDSGALEPNIVTYAALVAALCKLGRVNEVFDKNKQMVDKGIRSDTISHTITICGFSKLGDVEKALGFVIKMRRGGLELNLITYTAIMSGFCKKGKMEEAFAIFKMVEDLGIEVDEFMYATLIHGSCIIGDLDGVFDLLHEMVKRGINPSIVTYNTVMNGLCKSGRTSEANEISKGILGDTITYCTLLHGYIEEENITGILETKMRLEEAGVYIDVVMCNILNKALFMVGAFKDAGIYKILLKAIFEEKSSAGVLNLVRRIDKMEIEVYDIISNDAISFLCKRGFPESACEVYLVMRRKGSITTRKTYCTILKGLIGDGKDSLTQSFLNIFLKENGLEEPKVSRILAYYICLKGVDDALRFLDKMKDKPATVTLPVTLFNTLIKNGRVLDAYKLVMVAGDGLSILDAFDYSLIVDSLCKLGYINEALDLCSFAKNKWVTLDIIIYNSVINGLCRQGHLVEAFWLFDSLERINLVPTEITYATLIDALRREGFLLDAKEFFKRMVLKGFKPNTHVYNSIIDGYNKIGDMMP
ncbi:unnamed protein product [Malus baccata var. baccata]